jgi:hypothetical protein
MTCSFSRSQCSGDAGRHRRPCSGADAYPRAAGPGRPAARTVGAPSAALKANFVPRASKPLVTIRAAYAPDASLRGSHSVPCWILAVPLCRAPGTSAPVAEGPLVLMCRLARAPAIFAQNSAGGFSGKLSPQGRGHEASPGTPLLFARVGRKPPKPAAAVYLHVPRGRLGAPDQPILPGARRQRADS